jgi:hypothetical protein
LFCCRSSNQIAAGHYVPVFLGYFRKKEAPEARDIQEKAGKNAKNNV